MTCYFIINFLVLVPPNITTEDWIALFVGIFIIFLIAFLVTKYTKYGGGSNYGMGGEW